MDTQTVIQIDHLTKRYRGVAAISDVSFSVTKGEVVGFVGLNGAGKSTTINVMMGFLQATTGTVRLFDRLVSPQTAHKTHQQVGFASGDMSLFANLTGKQYLDFLTHRYKLTSQQRATELCQRFSPQLDKKIADLSRGNKQKIALIAAFMANPALVILDEPSSGLDPLMQQAFLDLVREESQHGTTIFMSSHYLNEVADVCSRVLLIRNGELVKDVPAHQLASASGKIVRVVSKRIVIPPKSAESVVEKKIDDGYELSFVFKGQPIHLQHWLTSVPQLVDFTITDHDLETAFSDIYTTSASEELHV
ncbi:MAG: ABC transporter ATP-binding protein [Candidatus Saccharimonadales bacterium]